MVGETSAPEELRPEVPPLTGLLRRRPRGNVGSPPPGQGDRSRRGGSGGVRDPRRRRRLPAELPRRRGGAGGDDPRSNVLVRRRDRGQGVARLILARRGGAVARRPSGRGGHPWAVRQRRHGSPSSSSGSPVAASRSPWWSSRAVGTSARTGVIAAGGRRDPSSSPPAPAVTAVTGRPASCTAGLGQGSFAIRRLLAEARTLPEVQTVRSPS